MDELEITRHRRFANDDPDLAKIRLRWEQALRQAVLKLPDVRFRGRHGAGRAPQSDTIELVEHGSNDGAAELQPQQASDRSG